jgi:hypothetical protein
MSAEAFAAIVTNKELFQDTLAHTRVGDGVTHYHTIAISKALIGPLTEISCALECHYEYRAKRAHLSPLDRSQSPRSRSARLRTRLGTTRSPQLNKFTGGKLTYSWAGEDPCKAAITAAWDYMADFAHRTTLT